MFRGIQFLFKQKRSGKARFNALSPVEREIRLEKRISYILQLLSVYATRKTVRKSLPANKQISMTFQGHICSKSICGWEQDFIRELTKQILNEGHKKLRFYVDMNFSGEQKMFSSRGILKITFHYYTPLQNEGASN
jgi:hypothetical protein